MALSGQGVRPTSGQRMASVVRCRADVRSHGGIRSHGGTRSHMLSGNHTCVLTSWWDRLSMPDRPHERCADGLPLQRQEGEGVVPKRERP
jgi:hypothetical protein